MTSVAVTFACNLGNLQQSGVLLPVSAQETEMEPTEQAGHQGIRELVRSLGRDEMNLAELPIALLTDRVPDGLKTLEFEAGGGRLIVTGSDAYGLPTAMDADVIVGLIQLTKLRNNFTDPVVDFTRYELLRILGWPDRGENYRRLEESLHRWVGVTLRYDEAWWDNEIKCRVDASFHILESVVILDQSVRRQVRARGRQDPPKSQFMWNRIFFRSCQADNLKRLDLETYFALSSAVSKQVYRFLDKRFYSRPDWTFDLHEFAQGHVGLSRNYSAAKIKEKLQPAIEELEATGFLEPMGREERYTKVGRGRWKIALVRKESGPKADTNPVKSDSLGPSELEVELVARGITQVVAAELVAAHPEDSIRERIEVFDWLAGRMDRRISRNPGGYLVESIRKGYVAPKGFESTTGRVRRLAEAEGRRREAEEAKRRADEEQRVGEESQQARIAAYWNSLSPGEQERLQSEALANASSYFVGQYRKNQGDSKLSAWYLKIILDAHIVGLLGIGETKS
jgi:hypothetical protein